MNLDDIKALAHLIQETGISELEIEEEGVKIRMRGPQPIEVQTVPAALPPASIPLPPMAAPAEAAAPGSAPAPLAAPPEAEAETPANWKAVESPMVGTFYRSPSPEADPYVQVGDRVKPDTVLCIVEAMKLMNEIKAEVAGTVRKVCVENSQPVEFGQPMFLIEPA